MELIVFLGPSLPLAVAKRTLPDAEFRPPIKRGDLENIQAPAVVGIIDGVFGETLAISPLEIRDAIQKGIIIYGAASMGALRAAEIPKMKGIGRIYEMYKDGSIDRDDEVALLFAPDTYQAVTVPMINLRYAVDRLVRSTTLNREDGDALIESCERLHFRERTYRAIFANSKLAKNADANDIINLLRNYDLKRDDAQFLLETLASLSQDEIRSAEQSMRDTSSEIILSDIDNVLQDDHILIWESGDLINIKELTRFLHMTGRFEPVARNTLARFAIAGRPLRSRYKTSNGTESVSGYSDAQNLLDATRLVWGWESPEEAYVTLKDLGLNLTNIAPSLEAEVLCKRIVSNFAKQDNPLFEKALRTELWLNDLGLKREVMRLGALNFFTENGRSGGPVTEEEMDDAKRTVCRLRMGMQWRTISSDLRTFGITDEEQQVLLEELALARRAARSILSNQKNDDQHDGIGRHHQWQKEGFQFVSSIKANGSPRFSLSVEEALDIADQIAKRIRINRIGMIGQLDTLGMHIAQAFGERSGWSASFSSGKAETKEGARIGSIMEEVEIYSQDAFTPLITVTAPYSKVKDEFFSVDPSTLDIPYDSRYTQSLDMEWVQAFDLITSKAILVPLACMVGERVANDIFYSPRLGGKIFSSSGLGSGFSLAEATVHASAELIERHAVKLAELELDSPVKNGRQYWFVDPGSLPEVPKRIVGKYEAAGMTVRILDITPDIAVPCFYVRVYDDPFISDTSTTSDGFACHPDPEVAITMALLEAAQTKAGVIAGGREDYSLQARSLGRHERPRTMLPEAQIYWFCNDMPTVKFDELKGFITQDILEELEWIIQQVQRAGLHQFIVNDLSNDPIKPGYAVRVTIPGIETTNPLFTGTRARLALIRDILPRN